MLARNFPRLSLMFMFFLDIIHFLFLPEILAFKGALQGALSGNRPASSARPVTSGGRYLRLGTASMLEQGDKFIMSDKLNPKNVNRNRSIARVYA